MTVSMPPRLREGIQVVDRSWMPGEPGAMRLLASMDAEVMRIAPMDPRRVALARHVPPCLQASLAILEQINNPNAAKVRAQLAAWQVGGGLLDERS